MLAGSLEPGTVSYQQGSGAQQSVIILTRRTIFQSTPLPVVKSSPKNKRDLKGRKGRCING